jgi:hypothetical protein
VAIQWTAALQNNVALTVYGYPYADLKANEKAFLDNSNTPAVPTATPGGKAGHALTRVQQFAQWYEQAGASSSPDAWEHVLVAEVATLLAVQAKPDQIKTFYQQSREAWAAAIDSYAVAATNIAALQRQTITYAMLRLHVIDHLIRMRPRLYVPVPMIDTAIQWAINHLWHSHRWNFRRRMVTMTIAANGAVTFDLPAGESFHSLASKSLAYTDETGTELFWLEGQDMARAKAADDDEGSTGRPEYFRAEHRVAGLTWHFSPAPDAEYTLRGEVFIAAPAAAANATDTAPFDKFPAAFRPMFPDLVLGKILHDNGKDAGGKYHSALDQINTLAPIYEDRGAPEQSLAVSDEYGDLNQLMGGSTRIGGRL